MNPTELRLAAALAGAPAAGALLAALLSVTGRTRTLRLVALAAGAVGALAYLALCELWWFGRAETSIPLFVWSPLGLYGVEFGVRPNSTAALLALVVVGLAAAGLAAGERHGRRRPAGRTAETPKGARPLRRAGEAAALTALAAALWVTVAADLVSLYLGITTFLVAGTAVLWACAGWAPAGRRLVVSSAAGAGLLTGVLILGKVNGHFRIDDLSTSGFTFPAFFGEFTAAVVSASLPPFHGWLLRLGRHSLAPGLLVAGVAVALTLLFTVFRVAGAELPPSWQHWLAGAGWLAAIACSIAALLRRSVLFRLAALAVGRTGVLFLAASVATPASMATVLLYALVTLPGLGALWLFAQRLPAKLPAPAAPRVEHVPATATATTTKGQPMRRGVTRAAGDALWRDPSFWLGALLIATVAGLPGTVGSVAKSALASSLTSWPTGDELHRLPLLLLDVILLIVSGELLWHSRTSLRLPRRYGWLIVGAIAVLVVGPVVMPDAIIGPWFGRIVAGAVRTGGTPPTLTLSHPPLPFSWLLGGLALWAVIQRLRGRESLPAPVRAALAAGVLVWAGVRHEWQRRSAGAAPASAGNWLWNRVVTGTELVAALLRPLEERYYAAAAVMVAVALIYIISR